MPRDLEIPAFLVAARGFYGEAFEPRRKSELAESMADWSELTEAERSFAMAHLQYMNLVAQADTQQLLTEVRDLLEEMEEGVAEALDGLVEQPSVVESEPEFVEPETLPLPFGPVSPEPVEVEVVDDDEVTS